MIGTTPVHDRHNFREVVASTGAGYHNFREVGAILAPGEAPISPGSTLTRPLG